jgi:GTP-binding protein Era
LFADDEVTDKPERFLVAEIVREKLMRQLGDEIPHAATVVIESFKAEENIVRIHADIYVEREGQKRIVIGKQGARLKLIGIEARKDIEGLLEQKVMLHLWVKVRKGWTNSAGDMRRLGYD